MLAESSLVVGRFYAMDRDNQMGQGGSGVRINCLWREGDRKRTSLSAKEAIQMAYAD